MTPIALTMGEPAGIGGEITLRAWQALHETGPAFAVIDNPERLISLAKHLGWPVPVQPVSDPSQIAEVFPKALPVLAINLAAPAEPGRPDPANAKAVDSSIRHAVRMAMAGQVAGLVTNPISKAVMYAGGFRYPGHTEFLAALTGSPTSIMMLASPLLRVVPVTVHVSLRRALEQLSTEAILQAARITAAALRRDFGIDAPRLAVAGLNPHAGENGAMGAEEGYIIVPAISTLQAEGLDVTGPHPPDTLFTERNRAAYDAAICMYHDQALIPLKTLDFDRGVNVTLGLPIVRTSPDHGTAFDIAGTGQAEPGSLIAAIELAASMAARRRDA